MKCNCLLSRAIYLSSVRRENHARPARETASYVYKRDNTIDYLALLCFVRTLKAGVSNCKCDDNRGHRRELFPPLIEYPTTLPPRTTSGLPRPLNRVLNFDPTKDAHLCVSPGEPVSRDVENRLLMRLLGSESDVNFSFVYDDDPSWMRS